MILTQLIQELHTFFLCKIYFNSILLMPVSHLLYFFLKILYQHLTHWHKYVKGWLSYIKLHVMRIMTQKVFKNRSIWSCHLFNLYNRQVEDNTRLHWPNHERPCTTFIIYWVGVKGLKHLIPSTPNINHSRCAVCDLKNQSWLKSSPITSKVMAALMSFSENPLAHNPSKEG